MYLGLLYLFFLYVVVPQLLLPATITINTNKATKAVNLLFICENNYVTKYFIILYSGNARLFFFLFH